MSNQTFNSIPNAITAQALANNFSNEEKSRREAAIINKEFYYGNSSQYLSTFNIEQEPVVLNLTKPVVHKRSSMMYNRKLNREFDGPSESIAFLEAVYDDNDIDSFMLNADLMAELTGSVVVAPVADENKPTKIKLQMWDGSQLSAVPDEDDPDKAAALSLVKVVDRLADGWHKGNPSNSRLIKQQIWTDDSITTYDGTVLVSSEENPYGFIPFVNLQGEEVAGQYVGWAPASLVRKLNAHINQMLTDLGYTIKMQSASPISLSGYSAGEGITITPGRAISLPAGATAEVLNFSPKITEVLATVQYLEEKIYETSSVPRISIVGGEGTSGRELLVRWFPLVQVYNEKTIRYTKYEKQLANTILKVVGLPEITDLHINFPDEDLLPLSASEEVLERDIILGMKTPVDEMIRRNPHLTEQEAIAIIEHNNEINIQIGLAGETPEEEPEVEPETETEAPVIAEEDNIEEV